jgi:hypothetical protein
MIYALQVNYEIPVHQGARRHEPKTASQRGTVGADGS